jgi:hypothetical protein
MDAERPRLRRAVVLIGIAIAAEIAMRWLAWRAPAFRPLVRPLYWIVPIAFALAIWHAVRKRSGHDRRHSDRRHET